MITNNPKMEIIMGVAETIREQLGNMALMMMGAKNLVKGEDEKGQEYLAFRIGKNTKSINCIRITLNVLDLYDIEFASARGSKYTVKNNANNIFVDQMHSVIEDNTGMYLSL
jgi:hypothetical protein